VALAHEPQAVLARLVEHCDELAHIKEAQPLLPVLFSQRALIVHGAQAAAFIMQPRWQGPFANVSAFLVAMFVAPVPGLDGEDPDYIIVVDQPVWSVLDAEHRDRLMFHELMHLHVREDEYGVARRNPETGKPLLKLVPHDCEVFHAELERYGPDVCGIEETLASIVEGAARAKRRALKIA
jgi:hypothetical protein